MWKRKQKAKEASEEKSTIEEGQADEAVKDEAVKDEASKEQQVEEVKEPTPAVKEEPSKKEQQAGEIVNKEISEETPPTEEEFFNGVFIFGKRVESGFKKLITALFTIFLLPPIILFGLLVITSVVLLAFPLIAIALPIVLLALCMLLIAMPVVFPFITLMVLITGKGKIHFGLENKKFAIKVFGLTLPPHADRQ